MWKEMMKEFIETNSNIRLNNPSTDEKIRNIENMLSLNLPSDLKNMLLEFDGDGWLLLSADQIVEINEMLRELVEFMPLDCFLFIARNGCGDYYGYPITKQGIKDNEIFVWDHEYDNRSFVAGGLKELINNYYLEKL